MVEQSDSRKTHGHAIFITGLNHIVISYGTSRLCHIFYTALMSPLDIVTKWKKGVGTERNIAHPVKPCPFLFSRKSLRLYSESFLPYAVGKHIHIVLPDIQINGIVSVSPPDPVCKL